MSSYLALLREDDVRIQQVAIQKLNGVVDTEWIHLTDDIDLLESFARNEQFPEHQTASLITSKIFFHLGEYNQALEYALGSGSAFHSLGKNDTYVDKIIERCIDNYVTSKVQKEDEKKDVVIDPRLENVVNQLFEKSFQEKQYKQILGIALESRRLDIARRSIVESPNIPEMLSYCLEIANTLIPNREFRSKILNMLAELFADEKLAPEERNYFGQAECYLFLDDWQNILRVLKQLISGSEDEALIAFQIAFDIHDRAPQHLIHNLLNDLRGPQPKTQKITTINEDDVVMSEVTDDVEVEDVSDDYKVRKDNLIRILEGYVTIEYNLDFLLRRNKADIDILNNIKDSFDKNSILHNATIIANSFMHSGTCVDKFLRDNLDWLSQAANWAKFTATASMGVIHKGNYTKSMEVLSPYLPKLDNPGATSVYSEGGALYALGLIHSSCPGEMTEYLTRWIEKEASLNPNIMHGACLGIGLTAMATGSIDLFDKLSSVCYLENAVSSESAAIAMGLVMLGSANENAFDSMLASAHETPHEKVIRGLALGMAFTLYGREEGAEPFIERMINDKDPIIRYGAMYAIGLAYCGTGNNGPVQRLLKIGVSDVSDDVRRAAIMNIGFIMFKNPTQVPRLLSLLAKSYNPHVRYGAVMALGIACAGTGLMEAIEILEELSEVEDDVDFVHQGVYIALAMILTQANENSIDASGKKIGDKVKKFREHLESIYKGRNLIMKKMGAIIALGILDAGGRNVTVCMHKNGHNKMRNIVGLTMFTQYWFWYPYFHFLSLSFEPTAIIALNKDLKMPEFKFKSNAPPSLFAYPSKIQAKEKEKKKIGPAAALSITKKQQREEKRRKHDGVSSPLTPFTPSTALTDTPLPMSVRTPKQEASTGDSMIDIGEVEEENFVILENPARVTPLQLKHITFDVDQDHYQPLKKVPELGFTLVKNLTGEEKIVEMKDVNGFDDEPSAPEPFHFDPDVDELELPA